MMRPSFSTLTDLYNFATSRYARRMASGFADGTSSYSYGQFKDCCDNISRILSNFGIGASDKVAILSENMPNWSVAFFAITAFGRIAIPMLPDLSHDEVENILAHSEAKAIFVSRKQLPKLSEDTIKRLNLVIDIADFDFIKATGESYTCDGKVSVPTPLDIAAILYTSGTTGNAKGVMLSHRNFCFNVLSSWNSFRIKKKDVFLSILPMAHTYELSIGMLYPFAMGARVAYLQKVPTPSVLLSTLKQIRPTEMLSVPLIIEKIYKSSIIPTINGSKFLQFLRDHQAAQDLRRQAQVLRNRRCEARPHGGSLPEEDRFPLLDRLRTHRDGPAHLRGSSGEDEGRFDRKGSARNRGKALRHQSGDRGRRQGKAR